jgi:hypothetical protein
VNGLIWIRGSERIPYTRPSTFFCLGVRGSGKSSFLESIGERYLTHGSAILDLFASRDGENLAWLRSDYAKNKKILLLRGSQVDVQAPCDVKEASKLELEDFNRYDILISSAPLYTNPDDEFDNASKITQLLYQRRHWDRLIYMAVREASNLYFSRLKIVSNQTVAKAEMVYLCREMRHSGIALGLDTLRFTAIDIDIRSISDYLVLKAQGLQGLSHDLFWLYSLFKPPMVQNLPKDKFIIVTKRGSIGIGQFDPIVWHKQEREDITKDLGLKIEYGEAVELGKNMGTFRTMSDQEHSQIVRLYIEGGIGMSKIAQEIGRSSATVKAHLDAHSAAVIRSGFCASCKRVRSPLETQAAVRTPA